MNEYDKELMQELESESNQSKELVKANLDVKPYIDPYAGQIHNNVQKEIEKVEQTEKHLFNKIDLNGLFALMPDDIKELTRILYTIDDIKPASVHFFNVLTMLSAVIGKKIKIENRGKTIYPNLWTCCLMPSGSNKSGINFINNLLYEISAQDNLNYIVQENKFTWASLYYHLGEIISAKEYEKMNSDAEKNINKILAREKCKNKRARIIISDEFKYTLDQLISFGAQQGESTLGQFLSFYENDADISNNTGTAGWRIIHDQCITMLGYSQPEIWNDKYATAENIASGLLLRFIVIDPNDFNILKIEKYNKTIDECKTRIIEIIKKISNKSITQKILKIDQIDKANELGLLADELKETTSLSLPEFEIKGKLLPQSIKLMSIVNHIADKELYDPYLFEYFYKILYKNVVHQYIKTSENKYKNIIERIYRHIKINKSIKSTTILQWNLKVNGQKIYSSELPIIIDVLLSTYSNLESTYGKKGSFEILDRKYCSK